MMKKAGFVFKSPLHHLPLWIVLTWLVFMGCNFTQRLQPAEATPAAPSTLSAATSTPEAMPALPATTTEPPPTLQDSPTATQAAPAATQPPLLTPEAEGESYVVVDVALDDVLNVRSGPGISNPVVGVIPPHGIDVKIIGEERRTADGALWAPVSYQGLTGWANTQFLARQFGSIDPALAMQTNAVIQALRDQDMEKLSTFVHPDKGVRFSPYTYVSDQDQLFHAGQVRNLWADPTVYHWGIFDGSGEPIRLSFPLYFTRFIYDNDFARPAQIGFNQEIGSGNTINNIRLFYPNAQFVEYHFPGQDPQYGGLDWKSLRLVFEEKEGVWYLVGVVHDEWTV
jgi:hypothetical protein